MSAGAARGAARRLRRRRGGARARRRRSAEQLFTDNCGNCHTLAAAGASGKVGPDLDQLRPGTDLLNAQITNGGGGMPAFKGKLSEEQIQQISDYVAENAGA